LPQRKTACFQSENLKIASCTCLVRSASCGPGQTVKNPLLLIESRGIFYDWEGCPSLFLRFKR